MSADDFSENHNKSYYRSGCAQYSADRKDWKITYHRESAKQIYFSQQYLSRDMIKFKIIMEMEIMAVMVILPALIIKDGETPLWASHSWTYTWTFVFHTIIPQFLTKIFLRILECMHEEASIENTSHCLWGLPEVFSGFCPYAIQHWLQCTSQVTYEHFSHRVGAALFPCRGKKKWVKKFEANCRRKKNFIIKSPGKLT